MATKPKKPIKIKNPGKLHKDTGTPKGKKIPEAKIKKALASPKKSVRKEAQFAENAKKFDKKKKK